jgi:hypothetical protein
MIAEVFSLPASALPDWQALQHIHEDIVRQAPGYDTAQWHAALDTCMAMPLPSVTQPRQRSAFEHSRDEVYRTAGALAPEALRAWYAGVFDRLQALDLGDPAQALSYQHTVQAFSHCGRMLYPLLREHGQRLKELLLQLAAQPEREVLRPQDQPLAGQRMLSTLIEQTASIAVQHVDWREGGGIDPEVATLVPTLLANHPVRNLFGYLRLLRGERDDKEILLARITDAVVRQHQAGIALPGKECLWEIGSLLFGTFLSDLDARRLRAFAQALRPFAAAWRPEGLETMIRACILDWHGQTADLDKALKRSALRRLVPNMLAALPTPTPARSELAERLAGLAATKARRAG